MLRATLLTTAMLLLTWNAFAQVTEEEKFKANGQGIIKIFTNYHSTFQMVKPAGFLRFSGPTLVTRPI
jgi:hypothetical protein